MTISRDAAIEAADAAVAELKIDYFPRLLGILDEIDVCIETCDAARLSKLCHTLREEAGTMGWPFVSESAGWLRDFHTENETLFDCDVSRIFAQSLRFFSTPEGTAKTEASFQLLRRLNELRETRKSL